MNIIFLYYIMSGKV